MTDKVQKIREEVARLKEETSIGLSEHENGVEQGRMEIIEALSLFLDSLQEEPVSEDLEKAAQKAYPEDIHKQSIFIHRATYAYTHSKNTQLLDEELEEAATKYAQDKYMAVQTFQAFKAGAEWQKSQGVTKEAVIGITPKEYFISISQSTVDMLDLCAGDKVIVQLRKKEDKI